MEFIHFTISDTIKRIQIEIMEYKWKYAQKLTRIEKIEYCHG